ncbi:MAG TPA: hypothetical protein VMK66_19750 [Myxococcales bacterium]|nr:hypothetical protein [Myxococcales bacterium]
MTALLTALAILLVGWFAVGTIWNVRKGGALMRWLQQGLPAVGERTTVRWLGSTAVEMVIASARAPFQKVTLVIFLEPRDMPWMWLFARRGGRRDTLILRGELRIAPSIDLEALDGRSWSGKDALHAVSSAAWSSRPPSAAGGLATWHGSEAALARADELLDLARRAGLEVRRLSVRRTPPHLQLHVDAPGEGASARALFDSFHALAERALH